MGGLPSLCSHHYYHCNHNHYHLIQYYPRSLSYNNIELHDITIPAQAYYEHPRCDCKACSEPSEGSDRRRTGDPKGKMGTTNMSEWFIHFLHLFTQLYHVIPRTMMWHWVDGYLMLLGFLPFFAQQNGGRYPLLSSLQDRDEAPGIPEERWTATMAAATMEPPFFHGKMRWFSHWNTSFRHFKLHCWKGKIEGYCNILTKNCHFRRIGINHDQPLFFFGDISLPCLMTEGIIGDNHKQIHAWCELMMDLRSRGNST